MCMEPVAKSNQSKSTTKMGAQALMMPHQTLFFHAAFPCLFPSPFGPKVRRDCSAFPFQPFSLSLPFPTEPQFEGNHMFLPHNLFILSSLPPPFPYRAQVRGEPRVSSAFLLHLFLRWSKSAAESLAAS